MRSTGQNNLLKNPKVLGMKFDTAKHDADATMTLTANHPTVILKVPGQDNQKVILPPDATSDGLAFWVVNGAGSALNILLRNGADSATIATIAQNESCWVVNVKGTWYPCVGANT